MLEKLASNRTLHRDAHVALRYADRAMRSISIKQPALASPDIPTVVRAGGSVGKNSRYTWFISEKPERSVIYIVTLRVLFRSLPAALRTLAKLVKTCRVWSF